MMLEIGVQTKNVVEDTNPQEGFEVLKKAGFSCADFSLNDYLANTSLYRFQVNDFFEQSERKLEEYFTPHKAGAKRAGIRISQMHMPYPMFVPGGKKELNNYLQRVVAPKSMRVCAFLECPYIVVHGFKLARNLGSESAEWKETERFIDGIAPMAKEMGITICIENLYESLGSQLMEGPCCDPGKAVERIDRMNDKYRAEVLGFCFDTGHANLIGLDFEEFMVRLNYRLKVFHIHDNDGIADLHQIPFTFTKTRENRPSTDWAGFVRGLKAIRFQGTLSFETAPVLQAFPMEMKGEVLAFIRKIGEYFVGERLQDAHSTLLAADGK